MQKGLPRQKGQILIFILLGIVMMAFVGVAFYAGKITPKPPQTSVVSTSQPTSSPQPSPTRHEDPWQNYASGQNIDGISINYPEGWKVNYRKEYNLSSDYKAKYRLAFDFAPPGWTSRGIGWMGWGILDFDVYDSQTGIDQWISKYSPDNKNNLTVKEGMRIGDGVIDGAKVGGKPTFEIESNVSQFGALVIFGSNYTYTLTHSQDGSDEFVKDEKNKTGIFQYIHIN